MTTHETSDRSAGGYTVPGPGLLVITDHAGRILDAAGRSSPATVSAGDAITDLVQERNHDLVGRILAWVGDGAAVRQGVGVKILGADGWIDALVTATGAAETVQWFFLPALADPLRATVAAVSDERELQTVLYAALSAVDEPAGALWASVHYGRDGHGRYRNVVTSNGRDTFRRSVEAAVSGDQACAWDVELHEEHRSLRLDGFGDGVQLAGPHVGIGACELMSIPAMHGRDAACLAVWSETAGQLEAPGHSLLVRRVVAAVTLAFQIEASRDGLRKLATRDGLTGLWNRGAFVAQLKAVGTQPHAAVVFADIDHFAALNEWHGHVGGDEVLIDLAKRLRDAMRPGDVIARVSADEFAVLCADVRSEQAATAIAERLISMCEEPFHVPGEGVDVNVSVGVAMAAADLAAPAMFAAAERAMQEAKDVAGCSWRLA